MFIFVLKTPQLVCEDRLRLLERILSAIICPPVGIIAGTSINAVGG